MTDTSGTTSRTKSTPVSSPKGAGPSDRRQNYHHQQQQQQQQRNRPNQDEGPKHRAGGSSKRAPPQGRGQCSGPTDTSAAVASLLLPPGTKSRSSSVDGEPKSQSPSSSKRSPELRTQPIPCHVDLQQRHTETQMTNPRRRQQQTQPTAFTQGQAVPPPPPTPPPPPPPPPMEVATKVAMQQQQQQSQWPPQHPASNLYPSNEQSQNDPVAFFASGGVRVREPPTRLASTHASLPPQQPDLLQRGKQQQQGSAIAAEAFNHNPAAAAATAGLHVRMPSTQGGVGSVNYESHHLVSSLCGGRRSGGGGIESESSSAASSYFPPSGSLTYQPHPPPSLPAYHHQGPPLGLVQQPQQQQQEYPWSQTTATAASHPLQQQQQSLHPPPSAPHETLVSGYQETGGNPFCMKCGGIKAEAARAYAIEGPYCCCHPPHKRRADMSAAIDDPLSHNKASEAPVNFQLNNAAEDCAVPAAFGQYRRLYKMPNTQFFELFQTSIAPPFQTDGADVEALGGGGGNRCPAKFLSQQIATVEFLSHLQAAMTEYYPLSTFRLLGAERAGVMTKGAPFELSWDLPNAEIREDPLRCLSNILRRQHPTALKYLFKILSSTASVVDTATNRDQLHQEAAAPSSVSVISVNAGITRSLLVGDLINGLACQITLNDTWGVWFSDIVGTYMSVHPTFAIGLQCLLHWAQRSGLNAPPPLRSCVLVDEAAGVGCPYPPSCGMERGTAPPCAQQQSPQLSTLPMTPPTLANSSVIVVLWIRYLMDKFPGVVRSVSEVLLEGFSMGRPSIIGGGSRAAALAAPNAPSSSGSASVASSGSSRIEGVTVEELLVRFFEYCAQIDFPRSVISIRFQGVAISRYGGDEASSRGHAGRQPARLIVVDPIIGRNLAADWSSDLVNRFVEQLQIIPFSAEMVAGLGVSQVTRQRSFGPDALVRGGNSGGRGQHSTTNLVCDLVSNASAMSVYLTRLLHTGQHLSHPPLSLVTAASLAADSDFPSPHGEQQAGSGALSDLLVGSGAVAGPFPVSVYNTKPTSEGQFLSRAQLLSDIESLHTVQQILTDRYRFLRNDVWWTERKAGNIRRRTRTDSHAGLGPSNLTTTATAGGGSSMQQQSPFVLPYSKAPSLKWSPYFASAPPPPLLDVASSSVHPGSQAPSDLPRYTVSSMGGSGAPQQQQPAAEHPRGASPLPITPGTTTTTPGTIDSVGAPYSAADSTSPVPPSTETARSSLLATVGSNVPSSRVLSKSPEGNASLFSRSFSGSSCQHQVDDRPSMAASGMHFPRQRPSWSSNRTSTSFIPEAQGPLLPPPATAGSESLAFAVEGHQPQQHRLPDDYRLYTQKGLHETGEADSGGPNGIRRTEIAKASGESILASVLGARCDTLPEEGEHAAVSREEARQQDSEGQQFVGGEEGPPAADGLEWQENQLQLLFQQLIRNSPNCETEGESVPWPWMVGSPFFSSTGEAFSAVPIPRAKLSDFDCDIMSHNTVPRKSMDCDTSAWSSRKRLFALVGERCQTPPPRSADRSALEGNDEVSAFAEMYPSIWMCRCHPDVVSTSQVSLVHFSQRDEPQVHFSIAWDSSLSTLEFGIVRLAAALPKAPLLALQVRSTCISEVDSREAAGEGSCHHLNFILDHQSGTLLLADTHWVPRQALVTAAAQGSDAIVFDGSPPAADIRRYKRAISAELAPTTAVTGTQSREHGWFILPVVRIVGSTPSTNEAGSSGNNQKDCEEDALRSGGEEVGLGRRRGSSGSAHRVAEFVVVLWETNVSTSGLADSVTAAEVDSMLLEQSDLGQSACQTTFTRRTE